MVDEDLRFEGPGGEPPHRRVPDLPRFGVRPVAPALRPSIEPVTFAPTVEAEHVHVSEPERTLSPPTLSAMQEKFVDAIVQRAPGTSLVEMLASKLPRRSEELFAAQPPAAVGLVARGTGEPIWTGAKPTTLMDLLGVSGSSGRMFSILIEVPEGEPIRIGPGLTDPDIGGPLAPPKEYPGDPPRPPRPPGSLPGLPTDPEWWKKKADRSAEFLSAVYCCFDFFANFTVDDVVIAEMVPIKDAFSEVSEELPEGHPQKDPAHPERRHASAQFDQAKLQAALDKAKKAKEGEHVFWNDMEDLEIVRREGTAGQPAAPPAKKEGETEEERKKREEEEAKAKAVKEAADAIKPGKLKVKVKIKDKKPPPKPGGGK